MWTLIIVLVSSVGGANYTPTLEGFDDQVACQETRDWFEDKKFYKADAQIYIVSSLSCVRSQEI